MSDKTYITRVWKKIRSTTHETWEKVNFRKATTSVDSPDSEDNRVVKDNGLTKSLAKTQNDLDKLLTEKKLSRNSREVLAEDRRQLMRIIDKLENKKYHIAVFGRVSVGKSSLLNALLGQSHFSTSVLHGETKETSDIEWTSYEDHALQFIDTPGIDEFDGQLREAIAKQAVRSADMVLFVVDGDLTQIEYDALASAKAQVKSLIVVVNKSDRLTREETQQITASITEKLLLLSARASASAGEPMGEGLSAGASSVGRRRNDGGNDSSNAPSNDAGDDPGNDINADASTTIPLVFVAADARKKEIIRVASDGSEKIETVIPDDNIDLLKEHIWLHIRETGHQLQALSAAMFATKISDKIGEEIVLARADVAKDVIQKYCIGKALAVGLNPIPFLDVSVVVGDVAMIKHLGTIYGFDINKREASQLLQSIIVELGLVLGTSFGIQALSSLLKGLSAGLSTVLTASAQGVAAYYGTYLVGKACEEYFKKGARWGDEGAAKVLEDMLDSINKDDVLAEAKADIRRVLM